MRGKLMHDVMRKFGPVFGSKQNKALRQEILSNVLDRFDEEIQNGASEEDAYYAALNSVGNLEELKASIGLLRLQRGWKIAIIVIFAVFAVFLIAVSVVVGVYSKEWRLLIGTLIALAVTGTAGWRLASGKHSSAVPHIIAFAIGCQFLLVPVGFSVIIGMQIIEDASAKPYDYTERYTQVSSVALVKTNNVVVHNDGTSDIFDYTVIKELDRKDWEPLLKDCAKLKYRGTVYGHPIFLTENQFDMILIRYNDSADGVFCTFYGLWDPGYLQGSEDDFTVHYDIVHCDSDQWETVLKTYFDDTP